MGGVLARILKKREKEGGKMGQDQEKILRGLVSAAGDPDWLSRQGTQGLVTSCAMLWEAARGEGQGAQQAAMWPAIRNIRGELIRRLLSAPQLYLLAGRGTNLPFLTQEKFLVGTMDASAVRRMYGYAAPGTFMPDPVAVQRGRIQAFLEGCHASCGAEGIILCADGAAAAFRMQELPGVSRARGLVKYPLNPVLAADLALYLQERASGAEAAGGGERLPKLHGAFGEALARTSLYVPLFRGQAGNMATDVRILGIRVREKTAVVPLFTGPGMTLRLPGQAAGYLGEIPVRELPKLRAGWFVLDPGTLGYLMSRAYLEEVIRLYG